MRRFFIGWIALGIIGLGFLAMSPHAQANVTISNFAARWQSGKVVVEWKTGTEKDFVGYNIYRSESASGPFSKIHYESRPECMLQITGCNYSVVDSAVTGGKTYYYQLESVNVSNQTQRHPVTAIAQAPATPTATSAPPTATRTRTPTMTATQIPGAPTFTPAPPTATLAPPTATPPPQFTPTRTRTVPPGVTPPTPIPPTPTARVAYVAQPTATRAVAPAVVAPATASPEPTRAAIAVKDPESDDAEAEPEEDLPSAPDESDVRVRQLLIGAAIVLTGLMGAGGLVLGIFAIYLAFRK